MASDYNATMQDAEMTLQSLLTALEALEGYARHSRFAVVPLRSHLEGAADRLAGLCQQLEARP